jgi:O-acetyl-ADP-ribose deacetylase (regulator of RNase III)
MPTTPEKVYRATLAALRCANDIGAKSIVIPGMGTGVGGVSPEEAADAMVKALKEFSAEAGPLKEVLFCDLDAAMVKAWKCTLG